MDDKVQLPYTAEQAEKALQEAVKEAIERHKRLGIPSAIWKDGRLCYIMPDGSYKYGDEECGT